MDGDGSVADMSADTDLRLASLTLVRAVLAPEAGGFQIAVSPIVGNLFFEA